MAGRTSARSSASRHQASSPPNLSRDNGRQTRSGRSRSQSTELGANDRELSQRRSGRRGARQGSAESLAGDAPSRKGGRKVTGTAARNLSMVAEDREEDIKDSKKVDEDMPDAGDDDDAASIVDLQSAVQLLQSPGGGSQMSGTTAFSAATSHSVREVANIEPMAAEKLPELFTTSWKILELLAPQNASRKEVESIIRDLRTLGSKRAKRLKIEEDSFKVVRELYGSDTYIQKRFIFLRLLGNQNPENGPFRPDAIIHTANIATMVKELMVIQKESPRRRHVLMDLDRFPEPFLGVFDDQTRFEEAFKMALDIRTQFTIATLSHAKEQEDFDPDEFLTPQFFDNPTDRTVELDLIEDILTNGSPKGLPGGPATPDYLIELMKERVVQIRSTFRENSAARDAGDVVDFEQLDELFPWLDFLSHLIKWSRAEVVETSRNISKQGGVQNIAKELIEVIQNNDSQASVVYNSPPSATQPRHLEPAVEIRYPRLNTKEGVGILERLKRGSASSKPNKQPQKRTQARPRSPVAEPFTDNFVLPSMGDDDEVGQPAIPHPRPTDEYDAEYIGYSNERNKENRPRAEKVAKRSLLDRQANAEKVTWSSQESDNGPVTKRSAHQARGKQPQKAPKPSTSDRQPNTERVYRSSPESFAGPSTRKRASPEVDQEDVSEDEGFEGDKRATNPSRRKDLPPSRPYSSAKEKPRPSKRARVGSEDEEEIAAPSGSQARSRNSRQPSARRFVDEEDEDADAATPPPTARQVNQLAINAGNRARPYRTQKRIPWSEEDTQYLIEGIEEYGCSWATLWKLDGWEVQRDQVALKDKGRNLKTAYLKAGVPLPVNFEHIAIGKKEIAAIKAVRPNWEP